MNNFHTIPLSNKTVLCIITMHPNYYSHIHPPVSKHREGPVGEKETNPSFQRTDLSVLACQILATKRPKGSS